jgi:hypothetical protein
MAARTISMMHRPSMRGEVGDGIHGLYPVGAVIPAPKLMRFPLGAQPPCRTFEHLSFVGKGIRTVQTLPWATSGDLLAVEIRVFFEP